MSAAGLKVERKPRLVTLGCNVSGALGRGELGKTNYAKAEVVQTSANDAPVQVAAGWGHTAFVTELGNLVACGRAFDMRNVLRFGKLARDRPNFAYFWTKYFGAKNSVDFPELTIINDSQTKCVMVRASAALTMALTTTGEVLTFGANRYGQTGIADTTQNTPVFHPQKVKFPENTDRIIDVSLGHQNACAVDAKGDVYTWGKGDRGQLGGGDEAVKTSPRRLPEKISRFDDRGVIKIVSGFSHCAALTESGRIFVWGKNQLDRGAGDALSPVPIVGIPAVIDIASGQFHMIAKDRDGHFYQWGLRPSELGGDFVESPRLISGVPRNATQLACGMNESAAISGGIVYTWTWKDPRPKPFIELSEFHVNQLSFGWRHVAAIVA